VWNGVCGESKDVDESVVGVFVFIVLSGIINKVTRG
jgi:hypothetical protein